MSLYVGDQKIQGIKVNSSGETETEIEVSVTQIENGVSISVTDKNGTEIAYVYNGTKGDPGTAGTTPVRGTDYWTDNDKTEVVNDVLAALPTWTGGSY